MTRHGQSMLTFFRKIRKSLIDSSSARKYVLYAIGEIALVVIGILIALQINNWNEARKERILGEEYLVKIYADLKNDFIKLQNILTEFEEKNESALAVAKIMEAENQYLADSTKFRDDLVKSVFPIEIERQRNTWDELNVSGSQNIYRDDSLDIQLLRFYSNWGNRIISFSDAGREVRSEARKINAHCVNPLLLNNASFESFRSQRYRNEFLQCTLNNDKLRILFRGILASGMMQIPQFEPLLTQAQSIISYMEETYPDLLDKE